MPRLTIPLEVSEKEALFAYAEREYRDPRSQAALFVRQGLERLGFLPGDDLPALRQMSDQTDGLEGANG